VTFDEYLAVIVNIIVGACIAGKKAHHYKIILDITKLF